MLVHNLKLIFRQLAKNKLHTSLAIVGFAFGSAVCLIIALFIHYELTMDTSFKNHKRIYRLIDEEHNRVRMVYDDMNLLRENYPEIEEICPVEYHAEWARPVYTGEKSVYIRGSITTDSTFFDLFSIPIIKSVSANPFKHPSSVVLTESGAALLFGDEDPLGKQITLDNDKRLMVSGVIPDFPENSSMKADILLNAENESIRASHMGDGKGGWNYSVNIYALLHEKTDPGQLTAKMNRTLAALGTAAVRVGMQRLDSIYLGRPIQGNDHKSGNSLLLIMFGAIGLLLLALSMINHITFILSFQLKKLKEIGIRKTNGAGFRQLMAYHFMEVLVWVLIPVVLALLLVESTLPFANHLFGRSLDFAVIFSMPFGFYVLFSLIVVVFVTILAPTYLLSRFDINQFISGNIGGLRQHRAKRIMTVLQFAISIMLLAGVFVIHQQIEYMKHRDLGFEEDNLLMLKFPYRYQHGQAIQNRLRQYPSILSSSLSMGNPGNIMYTTSQKNVDDKEFKMYRIDVDGHFLETFGIRLLRGRTFLQSERDKACLINETAFKKYGWENLEGKQFDDFTVVGVVEDFHVSSLHDPMEAVSLVFDTDRPSTLNLRILPDNIGATMGIIRETWESVSPETPFEYQFYDDWYDALYRSEERFASTIQLFTVIAFFITCLGLLGQSIQICINRTKEVGIRKVLGASAAHIGMMLTSDFMKNAIKANLFALPLGWLLMKLWLQNFAYHIHLTAWPFILAGLLSLVIVLLTVSWQTVRAATANPVEALRYE